METENKPLDLTTTLNDVDTSMPVLTEGQYFVELSKLTVVDSQNIEGQKNLKAQFRTLETTTSTEGKELSPGFPVTRTIPLTESWLPDVTRLIDAALGTSQGNRPGSLQEAFAQMQGRQLFIKVTTRKTDEYGLQNDVRGFLPANS